MSLLEKIGGGILRLGAKVARSAAEKGATKTKDAVKKGVQNKRVADSKKVPKSQRTKKQQAARDKKAADIKAKRQAARAKRDAKIKNKTTGIKGRFAKTFGAGGLGGLIGSLLGGGEDANDPTPKDGVGEPQPRQTTTSNVPDDKPIDLSWLPLAMAVSIPTIKDDEERRTYSLSNIIVTKDIELDEEGGIPFIESGTLIPTRIAEIGTLFAITDTLRDQVTDLNKQMFIANSNLKEIKKKLGLAIAQNAATNRKNERRRDEEAVEGGRIKKAALSVGGAAAAYVTVKTMGMLQRMVNVAILGSMALFADDVASMISSDEEEELPLVEDQDEADAMEGDDTTGTGVDPTEEEISEEAAEPQSELADALEGAADAMSEGAAGTLLDAGMIAGGGAMVAGTLGLTATAAVLGPAAAAATALGAGMAVGTIIADNTQIDENISQAYEDFNEENLDEMTSREEMTQKYGDAQGTVGFFGDLLGEGLFDTEEDPKDIYAAFRDMTWDDHAKLNEAYQEEYGQSLASATWKAVGDAGSEAINDLISKNTMDKHLAKTSNEGDGAASPEITTSTERKLRRGRVSGLMWSQEQIDAFAANGAGASNSPKMQKTSKQSGSFVYANLTDEQRDVYDEAVMEKAEQYRAKLEQENEGKEKDSSYSRKLNMQYNRARSDVETEVVRTGGVLGDKEALIRQGVIKGDFATGNVERGYEIDGKVVTAEEYNAELDRLSTGMDDGSGMVVNAGEPIPIEEIHAAYEAGKAGRSIPSLSTDYSTMSKSELADEAMKGNADPEFQMAMIKAGFSDEEVDIARRKGRYIARQNAIANRKQLDEQQRVEEEYVTTTRVLTDKQREIQLREEAGEETTMDRRRRTAFRRAGIRATDELNSKVDTVVDETLDEKIKSVIVPMIQNASPKKERGIPSGTTMTPTLETATPQFVAVDPFLTNRRQT